MDDSDLERKTMNRRVIVFGIGQNGKKLVDECLRYDCGANIVAIADNYFEKKQYKSIPVIRPDIISQYEYDEVWVATVYFKEAYSQLIDIGVSKTAIFFMEPVLPILEYRIRKQNIERNKDNMQVLDYLDDHHLRMYCYDFYDEYFMLKSEIKYDDDAEMFFGTYQGKRLYLSRTYDTEEKARAYYNSVIMEQDNRSPHCYFNHEWINDQKGISVDVGAAEGIYGLRIIDQIEHLYLIEVDLDWIDALKYTFKDYMDKVTIIRAFVGNKDDDLNMRLDTILRNVQVNTIKMDIEGEELNALKGAERTLADNDVHLAVCTYHHKDDNETIMDYLLKHNFDTVNSEGVVVCYGDWELDRDEVGFRKALLFADKRK